MILVPRQLQRAGMTGRVPYYGGRLTPAQIYSLQHPDQPVPASVRTPSMSRSAAPAGNPKTLRRLRKLHDDGVITDEELAALSARVAG
jgi:hypothetical protein